MAASFSFSTTPILSGHSVRIYNTSTNWSEFDPNLITRVDITIESLNESLVFTGNSSTFTKTISPASLIGDFNIDLTVLELTGQDGIMPDGIYNFDITMTGTPQYTYNTDEVFYYNAWVKKSNICYNALNFIQDLNCLEIKYSCMVNALYQGLISDISIGDTAAIYEKLDLFNRITV